MTDLVTLATPAGINWSNGRAEVNVLNLAQGLKLNEYEPGGDIVDSYPYFVLARAIGAALGGVNIHIPRGRYYSSREIENDGPNNWYGDGSGGYYFGGTQIYFAAGVYGFINQSGFTSSTGGSGENASLSRISINALGKTAGTWKHGLVIHRAMLVSDVRVGLESGPHSHGFSGNGVHIVGATDINVMDARQFWKADRAYTVGDTVRKVGSTRNLMSLPNVGTLSITATGSAKGTVVFARSGGWTTVPSNYDLISIEAGSALAGGSSENVGLYFCDPAISDPVAGSTTCNARKISDSPYLVTGFYTEPVTVSTGTYATTALKCYPQSTNVYICIAPGTSTSGGEPTGTDTAAGELDDDLVPSGLCWRYITQFGAANDFELSNVNSTSHGGNALYIDGADANQIRINSFSGNNCGGWGAWDDSFIGCNFDAPHTSANAKGPYRNAWHGNSRTKLNNPYAEAGQGTGTLLFTPGRIDGGIHGLGSDIHAETTALKIIGAEFSAHYTQETQSGKTLTYTTLRNSAAASIFSAGEVKHTDDPDGMQVWGWDSDANGYKLEKTNYQASLRFFGNDFKGAVQASGLAIRTGYGAAGAPAGATDVGQRVHSSNGYPLVVAASSNHFYAGDVVWNRNYATDKIKGWNVLARCGSGIPWAASTGDKKEGATVTPSAGDNGYVYRRKSTSTAGAYTTGTDEPGFGSMAGSPWPTTLGNTVTESTGIIWECFGLTGNGVVAGVAMVAMDGGATYDTVASPGAVTVTNANASKLKGVAAFTAGTKTLTVNHPFVTAKTVVTAHLQFVDVTLTQILTVVPGAGSFVITCNANCTLATQVAWEIRL